MTEVALHWILLAALSELMLVAGYLAWRRYDSTRRLGKRLQATEPPQRLRRVALALSFSAAACFWFPGLGSADESLRLPALALLVGGAVVLRLSPRPEVRALGTSGVRSGWTCARFEQLVEWRLSGEHLRFRLEGRLWDSVEVAPERQAELRERLVQSAPDRESRYAV